MSDYILVSSVSFTVLRHQRCCVVAVAPGVILGDGPAVETRQVIRTRPGNDNSCAQDIVLLSFLTNVHIVSVCSLDWRARFCQLRLETFKSFWLTQLDESPNREPLEDQMCVSDVP